MSQRYHWEANSKKDVTVRETPTQTTDTWAHSLTINDPAPGSRNPLTIATDRLTQPARVIRVELDSRQAASMTSDTVTWNLSLSQIGPLKPGTVLVLRDATIGAAHTLDDVVHVGLAGFSCQAFSTSSEPYVFKVPGIVRSTSPATLDFMGAEPCAATLMNCENGLASQRVTFSRLYGTGEDWVPGTTVVRVGLQLIEPGARV